MLVSGVTQQPITIRADRLVNQILFTDWSINAPPKDVIGWGEYWETSASPNSILAWEQPVTVSREGLGNNFYDFDPINIQVDIMARNPEQLPYPIQLENMVFEAEKIITDNILAGVRPSGYYSMDLIGHQYIRDPNVRDKQLAVIFVKLNVRMVNV